MPLSSPLVSLDLIRAAAERLRPVVIRTPLVPVGPPVGANPLFVKCENLQRAGAFKIRGAFNMMTQLPEETRRRGVITYSSGNHGQAVALAASLLKAPAVIVMPTTAPSIKAEGARRLGAEVIFEGTTSTDRRARAEREAAARGLTIVPPFDHQWIIAGQGTIGLEILQDRPDVTTVFVQIGGGGLISGVSAALKQSRADVNVIGVEPSGAAKMKAALDAGQLVTLEKTHSVADGLLPVRAGDLTFAHARAFVDEVWTIDDAQIIKAVRWLFKEAKLVVEPSGAITVAAARRYQTEHPQTRNVVAVLSGGNVAPEAFAEYITRADPRSASGVPTRH
ncbi:MAG: threonine/serine dehydratase [Acidobacteria bacterium]|nr:threonine/serine dehydratase [Acidobacteriota bacterium]